MWNEELASHRVACLETAQQLFLRQITESEASILKLTPEKIPQYLTDFSTQFQSEMRLLRQQLVDAHTAALTSAHTTQLDRSWRSALMSSTASSKPFKIEEKAAEIEAAISKWSAQKVQSQWKQLYEILVDAFAAIESELAGMARSRCFFLGDVGIFWLDFLSGAQPYAHSFLLHQALSMTDAERDTVHASLLQQLYKSCLTSARNFASESLPFLAKKRFQDVFLIDHRLLLAIFKAPPTHLWSLSFLGGNFLFFFLLSSSSFWGAKQVDTVAHSPPQSISSCCTRKPCNALSC